mgnify:CR=1 FL=1
MRITTNMIYDRNLASMSKVSERQNTAYNQLMTGDKFSRSGEDPAGMSQKMALTKEIDLFKQYGVNGSLLENSLGHEETVLTSLNSAMLSAQTLIQKANNSAMGSEERSAIASEVPISPMPITVIRIIEVPSFSLAGRAQRGPHF